MSKLNDYRDALKKGISEYYGSLNETDKIKRLKLTEEYIDDFATDYFQGEEYNHRDRQFIKSEGQNVYDDFTKSIGLD